jgi:hypothetical protein
MEMRPPRAPWVLVLGPVFVLWANLHGLYVVGLGVLAVYVAFTFIGRTPMAPRRWWALAALALAFAGTVLTPAGLAGLVYPLRYLEPGDWGLGYIHEWNSPNFHEPAHLLLLGLIGAVGLGGFRGVPAWLAVLAVVSIPASLLAMRSAPVAAVLALPALAFSLDAHLGDLAERRARRADPARSSAAFRLIDLAVAVTIAAVALLTFVPRDLGASIQAETERRFPVQSVDWLEANDPDAQVFADYAWGGYVASRLHGSGGANFIDGRNDMFDQAILEDFSAIRFAEEGWQRKLDDYGATAILLAPAAPLTPVATEQDGWCEVLRTDREVLFVREPCPEPGVAAP